MSGFVFFCFVWRKAKAQKMRKILQIGAVFVYKKNQGEFRTVCVILRHYIFESRNLVNLV